jgi:hypothetical protein
MGAALMRGGWAYLGLAVCYEYGTELVEQWKGFSLLVWTEEQ